MYHSLTMHPVTIIYWTAWIWQIQTTQALDAFYLCMVLTHGWQSARVCALYAHMPCTAQKVGQWKKLAWSRDLNTRPLLAISLNPFYNMLLHVCLASVNVYPLMLLDLINKSGRETVNQHSMLNRPCSPTYSSL